jgi:hypothetical protein
VRMAGYCFHLLTREPAVTLSTRQALAHFVIQTFNHDIC